MTRTVENADESYISVIESCDGIQRVIPPATASNDRSGPFDMLPQFKGYVKNTPAPPLSWQGKCFRQSTAYLKVSSDGYTIVFDLADPVSMTCTEMVLLPTAKLFNFHTFFRKGHHEVVVKGFADPSERSELLSSGLGLFVFPEKILPMLMDGYALYKTFVAVNNKTVTELVKFHKDYFGHVFPKRTQGLLDIPDSAIQTGDVFGLHAMNADYTFDWMSTGGHIGHVAIAMVIGGAPYVFETTDADFLGPPGPPYGFHMTPFQKWKALYNAHDYEISWFRLRKDLAARITQADLERAYEWYKTHEMPFDVPSILFVALDTANDNYPPPTTPESLFMLLIIAEKISSLKDYIDYRFLRGLNQRFVKYYNMEPCGDLTCAHQRAISLNMTLSEVAALPEIDGWRYYDTGKPSIVCATVVSALLRELGVIRADIQVGEQTPKDVSQFGIYDTVWADRPAVCWGSTAGPKEVPWCQIAGRWGMDLPEYSSVVPYDHMNEKCGSMPPSYHRFPDGC